MSRIKYIDSIKGFAAICVVVGHVVNGYWGGGADSGVYYALLNALYAFHMPLFFTVSGFLFAQAYLPDNRVKKEKIKAQLINLACVYLLFSLVLGVSKMLFSRFVNNRVTAIDLALIPIKPIELYWYLFVLMIDYLVFSRELILRRKYAAVLAVTFALGAASAWIPGYLIFDVKRVCYYFLFFYLGIVLNKKSGILEKKYVPFVSLPCIILLYVVFWSQTRQLDSIPLVNQVLGILCSLLVFYAYHQYKILGENRLLVWIGGYALEIYLLHTFFLTACRALFQRMNIDSVGIILTVSTVIGVLLPVAFSVLCKKMGIHDYLFNPYKSRRQKSAH